MKNNNERGILVSAGALVTAAVLALGGAATAHANAQPVPESTPVTITKLAQPVDLGDPATGEEIDLDGYTTIGEVVFNYYLVEDTAAGETFDIGTNAGQAYAAGLTAPTAPVGLNATGSFPATHPVTGVAHIADMPRGLYLVQEDASTVPAGVTASAPFLLPVPLTDPTALNTWLEHIYVYPKNSQIEAEKTVKNADALVVGDDVTWTIKTDIPRVANPAYDDADTDSLKFIAPDLFRIDDTLYTDQLEFVSAVVSAGDTKLTEGTHYNITPMNVLQDPTEPEDADTNPVVAITHQIVFTQEGRDALATAVNDNANAQVTVELVTTVLAAEEIQNEASIYPNSDSVTENTPNITPSADVRYGSVDFTKLSSNPDHSNLSGAVFELYTSEEAAKARDQDFRVTPTDNEGVVHSDWTTDAAGSFSIEGLRYSGYADGESFDDTDLRYQTYWLVEVTALEGHQLLAEPLEFSITGDRAADGFEITNQENTGGFELPLTGGMGTAFLTIGGIAILATVLLVARSRRNDEVVAE